MKIDSRASDLFAHRTQATNRTTRADSSASFATALAGKTQEAVGTTATIGGAQADFTNMTRQEFFDWSKEQMRNGEITPSEGLTFLAMTMKIRVSDGQSVPLEGDTERFDFTQKVRDGIQGALSRNDQATLNMLQSALLTMQKEQQSQIIGVNCRV